MTKRFSIATIGVSVKKLILSAALILSALPSFATDFFFTNFHAVAVSDTPFQIFPVNLNTNGSWIVTGLPIRVPATNGIATNVSLLPGDYELRFITSKNQNLFTGKFYFTVESDPDTNNVIDLRVPIPVADGGWANGDRRYVKQTNGVATGLTSSNSTFTGTVKLPTSGDTVGDVWTITNATTGAGEWQTPTGGSGEVSSAQLAAQGTAITNSYTAAIAAQATTQTADTITRIGTNNTAIANTYATIADLQGESVDIIARIADSNTVYRAEFARRGDFIPSGVTFWDDFEGTNTESLSWLAPSINPRTGSNYVWYPNAATSQSFTNAYRTNGYLFSPDRASATNSWAVYPTVDVGVKPSYFGARLKRVNTGYVSADTWVQFCFILSPTNNSIENAYHFAIFPESYVRCQYWSNNTLTDEIFDGGLTPAYNAGWVGHANNQDFVFQVWIDGTNITVDAGGWLFHTNDARLPDFGGRFLTAELFDSGGGVTNIWDVRVESIWAGENPLPPISSTASGSGLSPTNSPVDGYVPVATGSDTKWAAQSSSGSGETNTASNAGIGYHLFDQKIGVDFQFNTFTASSGIGVTSNANLFTFALIGNALDWYGRTTNSIIGQQVTNTDNIASISNTLATEFFTNEITVVVETNYNDVVRTTNGLELTTTYFYNTNYGTGSGSGLTNIFTGNKIYVDAVYGNNTTGVSNSIVFPFLTIAAARNYATNAGRYCTIHVLPGLYDETDIWRNGFDLHLETGARVHYTGASPRSILSDHVGAITNNVTGNGVLNNFSTAACYTNGGLTNVLLVFNDPSTNAHPAVVMLTNANSRGSIYLESATSYLTNTFDPMVFCILNGTHTVKVNGRAENLADKQTNGCAGFQSVLFIDQGRQDFTAGEMVVTNNPGPGYVVWWRNSGGSNVVAESFVHCPAMWASNCVVASFYGGGASNYVGWYDNMGGYIWQKGDGDGFESPALQIAGGGKVYFDDAKIQGESKAVIDLGTGDTDPSPTRVWIKNSKITTMGVPFINGTRGIIETADMQWEVLGQGSTANAFQVSDASLTLSGRLNLNSNFTALLNYDEPGGDPIAKVTFLNFHQSGEMDGTSAGFIFPDDAVLTNALTLINSSFNNPAAFGFCGTSHIVAEGLTTANLFENGSTVIGTGILQARTDLDATTEMILKRDTYGVSAWVTNHAVFPPPP